MANAKLRNPAMAKRDGHPAAIPVKTPDGVFGSLSLCAEFYKKLGKPPRSPSSVRRRLLSERWPGWVYLQEAK